MSNETQQKKHAGTEINDRAKKMLRNLWIALAVLVVLGAALLAVNQMQNAGASPENGEGIRSLETVWTDASEMTAYDSPAQTEAATESETEPETEAPTEADPLKPQFSVEPGFYEGSVRLELSSEIGKTIYYTTDGSMPTTESPQYTNAILLRSKEGELNLIASRSDTSVSPVVVMDPVDKATVVRAMAVDANGNLSEIVSHTYFIGLDKEKDYPNAHIVSIATDEAALFDYYTGIYCTGAIYDSSGRGSSPEYDYFIPTNYTQKGRDWERVVSVEIFDPDGTSIASQNMGMRIMGGSSRRSVQKSLKFYARSEYGYSKLQCELFPGLYKEVDETDDIKKFKNFDLRNGGDDRMGTKFRDAFLQRLISERAVSTQTSEPAVGFINGEYSGVYNLQEDYSDYYIQSHYGVPKDDVIMVKTEQLEEGEGDDWDTYQSLSYFVNHEDLSKDSVYAEYCEQMDIESLIDYFAFELYIENLDWIDVGNNYRLWRSRTVTEEPYQDGKWRWAVYDTEYSMGCDRNGSPQGSQNLLSRLLNKRSYLGTNFFAQPLVQNEQFRAQFVTTFMDICNSCFEPEHACAVLDKMYKNEYAPLLNDSIRRTGPQWLWDSDEEMSSYVEGLIEDEKTFLQGRTEVCIQMLTDELGLSGETAKVTVNVNDHDLGTVQIGTVLPEWKTDSWSGTYFTDYPITLTAIPRDGFSFSGWEGKGVPKGQEQELTITVPVKQAMQITANFS